MLVKYAAPVLCGLQSIVVYSAAQKKSRRALSKSVYMFLFTIVLFCCCTGLDMLALHSAAWMHRCFHGAMPHVICRW